MKGTIGFIGDENSSIIPILKNANANYVVVSPEDVQGQEFDYVIIDKQFQLPKESPYSNYLFVKDLYTMISRGRNGSIIIDANKQLENVIGANNVTTSQGFTPKLSDFLDTLKE
jgi:hypothetical protein